MKTLTSTLSRLLFSLIPFLLTLSVYAQPCQAPTATAAPATICAGSSAILTASGSSGTYFWYDSPAGGLPIWTGSTYATLPLSATTTYYVQTFSLAGFCFSPRTAVTITVIPLPAAPAATATPPTVCSGNISILTATAPGGTYQWFDILIGGTAIATGSSFTTPPLNITTTYYVQTIINGCAGPRTAVTVSVSLTPFAPLASALPRTVCSGGTSILTSTLPVFGNINWYDAGGNLIGNGGIISTPPLTTNTTFWAEPIRGACVGPRTPVAIRVIPVSAAPIVNASPSAVCAGSSSTLTVTNPTPGSIYQWFNSLTGNMRIWVGTSYTTLPLFTTTTYYVQAVSRSRCASPRTAITILVGNTFNDPAFETGKVWFKLNNQHIELLPEYYGSGPYSDPFFATLINTYSVSSIKKVFRVIRDYNLERIYEIDFAKSCLVDQLISELNNNPEVEYAEKVPLMKVFAQPNEPSWNGPTTPSSTTPNLWHLHQINALNAWTCQPSGDPSIVIAIVDNGVNINHQDLTANIWTNPGEIAGNGIDDDNNGYTDDVNGYDVADNDNVPYDGVLTHGTAVASIAAGRTDNALGVASISWNVKIMPVKVAQDGVHVFLYNPITGVEYAAHNGADIVNMSFGGAGRSCSQTFNYILHLGHDRGIIFVAAAGNDNVDINVTGVVPAICDHVITVGSTGSATTNDLVSSFSNYGASIDVMAPGFQIYVAKNTSTNDQYEFVNGTSAAAPLVSGLCALMKSYNPNYTPDQIENCIKSTCDNINPPLVPGQLHVGAIGSGRINAYAAMLCLKTPPTADFTVDMRALCVGQTAQFTDLSTGEHATAWAWDFNNDGTTDATVQNPTYTFSATGTYTVTLVVTNSMGMDSEVKSSYVFVSDCPVYRCDQGNWYFGSYGSVEFQQGIGPVGLLNAAVGSFPSNSPTINTDEGSITQSDNNCNLLFYSDGITVWGDQNVPYNSLIQTHQVINATGLSGGLSTTQSALSVPDPNNSPTQERYYLFTLPQWATGGSPFSSFNYTILENNSGIVSVVGSVNQLMPPAGTGVQITKVGEAITAVPICDGTGWFILATGADASNMNQRIIVYRLNSGGLSYVGFESLPAGENIIKVLVALEASPDGRWVSWSGVEQSSDTKNLLFEFDNSQGTLSLHSTITIPGGALHYGVSFSPNSKLLYLTWGSPCSISQYDMTSSNIAASGIMVGDNIAGPCGCQLGPDNRLYITQYRQNKLSVISFPDKPGLSCGFASDAVLLEPANCFPWCGRINNGYDLPNMIDAQPNDVVQANFGYTIQNCTEVHFTSPNCTAGHNWIFGDGNISTLQNPVHTYAQPGTYIVQHTIGNYSSNQSVTVGDLTAGSITGPDAFCVGGNLMGQYQITANSDANRIHYNWSVTDVITHTGFGDVSSISHTWPNSVGTGTVNVTVTSSEGCQLNRTFDVTINNGNVTPTITISGPVAVCFPVTYAAAATNQGTSPSYQWKINGMDVPGEISSVYSPSSLNVSDVITCVLISSHPCANPQSVTSNQITITSVNTAPVADAGPDRCFTGSPVTIGGSPTANGGTSPYTYVWSPTSGLSNSSAANPTATIASNTTYSVQVQDASGCTATDNVLVFINGWPLTGGGSSQDEGRVVEVDDDGNVYAAGLFQGAAAFNNHPLTQTGLATYDGYYAKYNDCGELLWIDHYYTAPLGVSAVASPQVTGIAVRKVGSSTFTYVTVVFRGILTITSTGTQIFCAEFGPLTWCSVLLKYDETGLVWFQYLGNYYITDIAVNSTGAIYLTRHGVYQGGISLIYVIDKYTDNGGFGAVPAQGIIGNTTVPSSGFVWARAIELNSSGEIYVAGYFSPDNVSYNVFTEKYDANGNFLWQMPGTSVNPQLNAVDLALDQNGNAYLVGNLGSTPVSLDFGGLNVLNNVSGMFIVGFNGSTGAVGMLASKSFTVSGLQVDNNGNPVVSGTFTGPLIFALSTINNAGAEDALTASWNGTGSELWAANVAGGVGNDLGKQIAINRTTENIYVTGAFESTATFGTQGTKTAPGTGGDMFITKGTSAGVFKQSSAQTQENISAEEWKISVYPNPTDGNIVIHFRDCIGESKKALIKVYNIYGQDIESAETVCENDKKYDLNLNRFAKGVYLLKVEIGDKVYTEKVILQ